MADLDSKIRKLRFEIGDGVKVANGTAGKITSIGTWHINGRLSAVVYKVNGQYWRQCQLTKIGRRSK